MNAVFPKSLKRWILGLHLFVGLGAVFGGLSAMLDPESPLGMSSDFLINGPFDNYFIPGLALLTLIGLGNLIAAVALLKKTRYQGFISGIAGAFLIGWIVIQCFVLQAVAIPHVLFFLIGAVQGILACVVLYRQDLFPMSLVKKWLGRKP